MGVSIFIKHRLQNPASVLFDNQALSFYPAKIAIIRQHLLFRFAVFDWSLVFLPINRKKEKDWGAGG